MIAITTATLSVTCYKMYTTGYSIDITIAKKQKEITLDTRGSSKRVNEALEDTKIDPSTNNNEALKTAVRYGHISITKCFLEDNRVDPSDNDNEAFRIAVRYGHLLIAQLLLKDSRVDPLRTIMKLYVLLVLEGIQIL
jgi:ankyrin repeat protein